MPTVDDLRSALLGVIDPELGDNVVDLGMVRDLAVNPDGVATVTIALTVIGCPLQKQLRTDVEGKVGAVPGVSGVVVKMGEMDAAEKAALMARARLKAQDTGLATDIPASARILAVASGKGGVGKSSVTANLAVSLAARGLTVGVLDADIWGFSLPRMLGVEGRVAGEDRKMVPIEQPVGRGRLKVLSMGLIGGAAEDQAIMWRGLILNRAVQHFLEDVRWGDLDYLLIDMPPGTGDVQMGLARMLPRADMVIVTTPALAAQKVASRAADMARRGYLRVAGVVENMTSGAAARAGPDRSGRLTGRGRGTPGGPGLGSGGGGLRRHRRADRERGGAADGARGLQRPHARRHRARPRRRAVVALRPTTPPDNPQVSGRDVGTHGCSAGRTPRGANLVGVVAVGAALGGELAQVRPHRIAGDGEERLRSSDVDGADELLDGRRPGGGEGGLDLTLAFEAVGEVAVEAVVGIGDQPAVARGDGAEAEAAEAAQLLEVRRHVPVGRGDHHGGAVHHVVAGEEQPFVGQQPAQVVGRMAGRVHRGQRADPVAVDRVHVGLEPVAWSVGHDRGARSGRQSGGPG